MISEPKYNSYIKFISKLFQKFKLEIQESFYIFTFLQTHSYILVMQVLTIRFYAFYTKIGHGACVKSS